MLASSFSADPCESAQQATRILCRRGQICYLTGPETSQMTKKQIIIIVWGVYKSVWVSGVRRAWCCAALAEAAACRLRPGPERFTNLISTKTNRGVIASAWHIWLLLKPGEGRNRVGVCCVCVLLEADTLHRVFQKRR